VAAAAASVGAAVGAVVTGDDDDSDGEAAATGDVAAADAGADDAGASTLSAAAAAMIANTNYPDDLTNINGIGRVYETRLYKAGIFTWDQIANASVQELEELTQAIDAANPEEWPAQAAELATANGREGARYQGPVPDKFSKLKGVGEGAEQRLYLAGIFTYAQLAATSPDDLAAAMSGYRGNFADWVAQAAALV
jgi:predicted flap endonuclease-1-like 5' DNA nuclease